MEVEMNVKTYCQVSGVVLLLLGVLGILGIGIPGFLSVNEPTEIALHFITGGLAAWAGFTAGGYGSFAKTYAQVFGAIYLVLGVIGFVAPNLPLGIHLDLACNLAHLVLGAWGVYVGFMVRPMAMAK
jgi:multisubunit Na+/H+ antiporter MnhG subunit